MIHLFELDNKKFIVDVNSGLIHEIDDLVYDLLETDYYKKRENKDILLKKYSEKDIDEACKELKELEDNKMIYTEDLNITPKIKPVLKAMCLNVAHDCNLRCGYCFASQGDYQQAHKSLISLETGKKALDYILKNSGDRRNLEVDFFGGEPLMNFDVCKELVYYGRQEEKKYKKNFRFTITTNGVLLDEEKMEFIDQHFDNVVMSLDGRKEVNDNVRVTPKGTGSYDIIVPNFKKAVKKREDRDYFIRGTFTGLNLDFSDDVKHMRDLGFKSLSMEPVVTEPGDKYEIKESDLEKVKEEYEKLYHLYKDSIGTAKDFNFFHFEIDLEHGPCIYKRISGCGAGNEYIAVTPEGDIYPCHQFVGNDDFKIGNLDEGIVNTTIPDKLYQSNVLTKEECGKCWAKYFCSGGCHANAWNFNGDFNKPYKIGCEMERKRIECAIRLKAERMI